MATRIIASVRCNWSKGVVTLRNRRFTIQRLRLPAYLTIRDAETDELVVRLCLVPNNGLLAEFDDGDSFRFGWVSFLKGEWTWTREGGETVLWSRRRWWRQSELRVGTDRTAQEKWPWLAVLLLAIRKL